MIGYGTHLHKTVYVNLYALMENKKQCLTFKQIYSVSRIARKITMKVPAVQVVIVVTQNANTLMCLFMVLHPPVKLLLDKPSNGG